MIRNDSGAIGPPASAVRRSPQHSWYHAIAAQECHHDSGDPGADCGHAENQPLDSALDLEQTLMRYAHRYNTQLPQSALMSRTPMQAMRDWHKSHPYLFVKTPRNRLGCDT